MPRGGTQSLGLSGWLCAVLVCGGCTPIGPMFTSPHEVDDPGYLSPKYRRFHEPVLPRLVPVRPQPLPAVPRSPGLQPFELPAEPVPQPLPSDDADGPELGRPGEAPVPSVELAVAAPVSSQIGSNVLFEIRVTNRGTVPAANVVLEANLDEGLRLPGRNDRRVVRPLGTLAAGETRQAELTLIGEQAGMRCASFLITTEGRESGWKNVCVDFVPRRLDMAITAPDQAPVGGRATFVVSVVNVSQASLDGVELLVTPDAVLRPVGGSAGARATSDGLRWQLGRLAAGERVTIEVECECRAAAERACLRARATASGLPAETVEHCLGITG